jgi:hypothetical protein
MTSSTDDLRITQPNNIHAGYTGKINMLWNGGGFINGNGLRLNLDGNGLTVGVWEAGDNWQISNTHREINGRIQEEVLAIIALTVRYVIDRFLTLSLTS